MNRKLTKITINETEGEYLAKLPQFAKFLTNDKNTLYFEYNDKGTETVMADYRFYVLPFNQVNIIPGAYEYICSFEDNAHIKYFVYYYDGLNGIFNNFFKTF